MNPFARAAGISGNKSIKAGSNNRTKAPKQKARSVRNPTSGKAKLKRTPDIMKQKRTYGAPSLPGKGKLAYGSN